MDLELKPIRIYDLELTHQRDRLMNVEIGIVTYDNLLELEEVIANLPLSY